MPAETDVAPRNQSLARGLALLRALADRPGGATVPALADATALPRTTTARLLSTLRDLGAVERVGNREWALGPEIARLGRVADPFHQLRGRAHEPITSLSREVGESAMIAVVYDSWETETILQVDAPTLVGATNWLGSRHGGVLHASATGKLALAQLSREQVRAVTGRMREFTPRTITDLDALDEELERTRARGWAATIDELETGLTAVATALDDPFAARSGGARLVSVSVSGPSARLPAERLPKVAARLERLARSLSRFAPAQSRAGR